ncbi:MAG: AAA family ATPase, partial [Phycisphaeraceae bacterium]|nr:AAA family ATPase [Phycisphaeraceae bacterium]
MITKWKVFNFKSIREETELDLGPLTIFAGANSSGKSTFIQSILLIAQTLAHKVSSRSVVLNGAFTSLGQFDDLKSYGREIDQISIKCTCHPLTNQEAYKAGRSQLTSRGSIYYGPLYNQLQEIACEMSFDADPSSPQRDLFQIQPRLFATQLSCISRDEDNVDQTADISIHHSSIGISEIEGVAATSEIDDQLRASLAYAVELDENSLVEAKEQFRSAKAIGCVLRHFLPEKVVYMINTLEEDANKITAALQEIGPRSMLLRRGLGREILLSEEIIFVLREVLADTINFDRTFMPKHQQSSTFGSESETITLKEWYEQLRGLRLETRLKVEQVLREREDLFERIYAAMKTSTNELVETHAIVQYRLPRLISEATNYLNNFFGTSLKYLGPLRDAPKPLYPLAPAADPNDVGLRGEHTASILELHKNKKIQYIPSTNFKNPVIDRKIVTRTLEVAVIDWLQYLGVANSVQSRDQGKLGHELKVGIDNSGSTYDLTHVGVGVSQVLPILVMCLLSDMDSTLV